MSWFLKKTNGTVYGPVELARLQRWAGDGRIAPGDLLSPDQQTWRPASDVPEMDMVWQVELPDGTCYGPIHLLAMGDLIRDGTVLPTARVRNRQTGAEHILSQVLLQALLAQSAQLAGAAALGREVLDMPVRVAGPTGVGGLTDNILNPAYSTAIGLLYFGARALESGEATRFESAPASGIVGRMKDALGHLLP